MMINDNYDIAIIGGGMVGASLALLLAHQEPHWRIALLEAQPLPANQEAPFQPSFDARSTAMADGSVEVLRRLGLWDELAEQATAIRQVHVSDAGHFMGGLIDAEQFQRAAVGYVVPNIWIGRVLLKAVQQCSNIHCLAPVQVRQLQPVQGGTDLYVDHQGQHSVLRCQLAVIADGAQSPLARQLGIDSQIKDYGQTAIIANVAYSQAHEGVAYERFTLEGPLALLPLGGSPQARESALVLTLPSAEADVIVNASDADFLAYLQQRFGYRLGRFIKVGQRHSYPLQLVTASEQIRSHGVLMGNAAHFLHPVAGQGFNLSLRDCLCLTNTLAQAHKRGEPLGQLAQLQDYLQQQALDQTMTIEFSDKLVRLFSSSALPLIALRHLGFLGLESLPPLKQQLVDQTMGTAGRQWF